MGMSIDEFEEYAKSHNILTMTREFYETRLKADIVAMLTEIQLEIEELEPLASDSVGFDMCVSMSSDIIQQKINSLTAEGSADT